MDNIWPEIGKKVRLIPKLYEQEFNQLIIWRNGHILLCLLPAPNSTACGSKSNRKVDFFSVTTHIKSYGKKNLFQQGIITRMRTFFNIYLWHGTCVHNIAYKSVMTRKYILKNKSRDSRMNCKNKDAKKDNQPH